MNDELLRATFPDEWCQTVLIWFAGQVCDGDIEKLREYISMQIMSPQGE